MPRLTNFLAPVAPLRPSETGTAALGQAGRRVQSDYRSVASDFEAQGRIEAQKYKNLLWPLDIAKLAEAGYAQRRGPQYPTIRFSRGIPSDEDVASRPYASHAQVSRGIGALGDLLGSDGGAHLANGGYPANESISGGPVETYDFTSVNKANAAMAAYNRTGIEKGNPNAVAEAGAQAFAVQEAPYQGNDFGGGGSDYDQQQSMLNRLTGYIADISQSQQNESAVPAGLTAGFAESGGF